MRVFFLILCCMSFAATTSAVQICKTTSIPASTPDGQLLDNLDGTITDSKTGLMWKQCLEGVKKENCEISPPSNFTWQGAVKQPGTVNANGGFAGYQDWRLPSIKELGSIVEKQCSDPAINLTRFPNTPSSDLWSGSSYAGNSGGAWGVLFYNGSSSIYPRSFKYAVRLVRGGQ